MPTIAPSGEGSLLLTGTFQTVFEGVPNKTYEGKIDLATIIGGDSVEIRGEEKIASGDAYRKFTKDITYTGPVDDPMVGFQPRSNAYGYRIQARQPAGTFRTIKFLFFQF
jgi:hypothetical protein